MGRNSSYEDQNLEEVQTGQQLLAQPRATFRRKVDGFACIEGAVMGTTKKAPKRKANNDERDPVAAGILRFIEAQMTMQPEDIAAADADQLRRIGKLVKGVKVGCPQRV